MAASAAATQLEAILWEPLLRAMFPDSAPLGGYGRGELARDLARGDGSFAAALTRALGDAP